MVHLWHQYFWNESDTIDQNWEWLTSIVLTRALAILGPANRKLLFLERNLIFLTPYNLNRSHLYNTRSRILKPSIGKIRNFSLIDLTYCLIFILRTSAAPNPKRGFHLSLDLYVCRYIWKVGIDSLQFLMNSLSVYFMNQNQSEDILIMFLRKFYILSSCLIIC